MWRFKCSILLKRDDHIYIDLKMSDGSKFRLFDTTYTYQCKSDGKKYLHTETISRNENVISSVKQESEKKSLLEFNRILSWEEQTIAKKKLLESNRILSFIYNYNIGVNEENFESEKFVTNEEISGECEKTNSNIVKIKKIETFIKNMKEIKCDNFKMCTRYFSKALELHYKMYLNEEALLNVFKIIEVISRQYYTEKIKDNLKDVTKKHFDEIIKEIFGEEYNNSIHSHACKEMQESIESLIDKVSKRKIKLVRRNMMIEDTIHITDNRIDKLVEFRNKAIAHGSFKEYEKDTVEHLTTAVYLAKQMIVKFFFEDNKVTEFNID